MYYELLVEKIIEDFKGDNGELTLPWFFLDIACQFEGYWDRQDLYSWAPVCHSLLGISMAQNKSLSMRVCFAIDDE